MESDLRAVLDGIRRIVRMLRESTRATEQTFGTSSAQLFVLQTLSSSAPLSINEIAARTLTHQSSASTVVSKLAERGLIRKQRSKTDGRRFELELTRKGRSLVTRAPETAQARLISGIVALPPKRRKELVRGLEAWIEKMNLGDGPASMFFEEKRE